MTKPDLNKPDLDKLLENAVARALDLRPPHRTPRRPMRAARPGTVRRAA